MMNFKNLFIFSASLALTVGGCGREAQSSDLHQVSDETDIDHLPANTILKVKGGLSILPNTKATLMSEPFGHNKINVHAIHGEAPVDRELPESLELTVTKLECDTDQSYTFGFEWFRTNIHVTSPGGFSMYFKVHIDFDNHNGKQITIGDLRNYFEVTLPAPEVIE